MRTVTIGNKEEMDLVNSYMSSLVHLTDRMKVELINRLSASLLSEKKADNHAVGLEVFSDFKGSWGNDVPVDEYCEGLRGNVPPRDVETW